MAALVSVDKMTPEAAAKRWLRDNRHKWKYWIGRSNVVYDAVKQQRIDQKYPTTQIAKKEPTQTQQVAKQATTTFKPIKKITQLKKVPKKEKKTIVAEVAKREPSKCDNKKFNKKMCKEFEKMERKECLKKTDHCQFLDFVISIASSRGISFSY